jgi:hypothetical protein
MNSVIGFIEFVIGAVVVLVALALILLVVVSRMPAENPLRQVLNLLIARIGVTAAAGALAIPIEPVPGLDVLYDIGAPILLVYYWYTFFRKIRRTWSNLSAAPRSRGPTIDHEPR